MKTSHNPSDTIATRMDFIVLFDALDCNPNGDPDANNAPRQDPETMQGLVSNVCLKRKVRNYINMKFQEEKGHRIYIQQGSALNNTFAEAMKKKPAGMSDGEAMCMEFYDVRAFGAVFTQSQESKQAQGPVQFTWARSFDPITPFDHAIVRCCVAKEEKSTDGSNKASMPGRQQGLAYGLYKFMVTVNPFLAEKTGFTYADLGELIEAIEKMFYLDQASSRGNMCVRKMYLIEHDSPFGSIEAQKLSELVKATPLTETPRAFSDYQVSMDKDSLPAGVSVTEII